MRFKISTHFKNKLFNISQRVEIKTNDIYKAFEVAKGFVIGSNSVLVYVWNKNNFTKNPDFGGIFSLLEVTDKGILFSEINFINWINSKKGE